jgi:hypothetical protein
MRKIFVMVAVILVAALQLGGCGSGSGSSDSLPPKTATIVFSAEATAALPVPVRTLKIVANIPAGVSVPLKSDGTPVFTTSKSGAFTGGSFIPPLLTITLADATSPSGLGDVTVGAFAEIIVSYPAGTVLTEASFTGINNPFPDFAASGLDSFNTTVPLTAVLKPSMKVTF